MEGHPPLLGFVVNGDFGKVEGSHSSPSSSSSSSSLAPPVSPKSPPRRMDLFGRRRQLLKVQILEREINLLQEELKLIESLQPASRCCKEVDNFIGTRADPLIATYQKASKSCRFWKRLWSKCCNLSWICCCGGSACCQKFPNCCACCHCSYRCRCCCCSKNRKRCKFFSCSCLHCTCCCCT